jgi:hypothetical protein
MENLVNTRSRCRICTAFATSAAVLLLGGAAAAQDPPLKPLQTVAGANTAEPEVQGAVNAAPAQVAQEIPQEPAPTSTLSSMKIRVYADVSFGTPLQEKLPLSGLQHSTKSFQIADLHLFVTSKLSDDWNFLTEALFTSDFTNEASAELDRLVFQYNPNKHLRVGFGKFNAAVGYYPNQFHRAKFYQTASGRPLMFTDEDNGGILPVHQVGITAQGEIPSGALGLHYIGEVTNGRSFNVNSATVQNFVDENNGKAVNAGLFVRPDAAPAFDAGFTIYRDTLRPTALEEVRETITAVHAVWVTPNFEFLNEIAVVKHDVVGTNASTATSKTLYTQLSNRFGIVRPYARYEYQDVPASDPVFGVIGLGDVAIAFGLRKAVSAGLHVDIGDFAVVKVQVDRALQFGEWANGVHAQLAFAF